MIMLPTRSDRQAEKYWEEKSKYFETFPGSAHNVERVGADAWFAAGTTVNVLTIGNEHFTVATRMVHPRSREFVINLAKAIVEQQ